MISFDAFTRLYDADYGDFTADLDLFLPFAERTGGPVLEAMCGTGRVLLPLVEAGHTAVGIDISPAMVTQAQQKLVSAEGNGRAEVADVRAFSLPERFALALIPMNSFMHLETPADQLAALDRLYLHLRPGGLLIIDLFNPDPHELVADQNVLVHAKTFEVEGHTVQKYVLRRTDWATQIHYVEFVYDEIGSDQVLRRTVLPFTMRWVYRYEMQYLLAQAGFVLDSVYGSYELDAYTSDSDRLIAVARRPLSSHRAGRTVRRSG